MESDLLVLEQQAIQVLTEKEQKMVNEFRQQLGQLADGWNDWVLIRFLIARKWSLDQSGQMFRNYVNWRQEFGTNHILTYEFPEINEVRQLYPHGYHKTDRQGRPIYIERVGQIKIKELFNATTVDRLLRYYVREYERVQKEKFPVCSKEAGKWISTSLCILDMKDVPLSQAKSVYNFVKIASSISQDYYPEMLGNMFIVNAPFLFSGAWSLVKPLIDKRTRQKIQIKGSSYQKELFELVDPANLPTFLSGTCECPNGCLNTNPGPWNPQSLPLDITGSIIFPEQVNSENSIKQPQEQLDSPQQDKREENSSEEEQQGIEELKQALKGFQLSGNNQQLPQIPPNQQPHISMQEQQYQGITPFNTMVRFNIQVEEDESENQNP